MQREGLIRRGAEPGRRETVIMRDVAWDRDREAFTAPGGLPMEWSCVDCGETASIDAHFLADGRPAGCFSLREFRPPPDVDDDPESFRRWLASTRTDGIAPLADAVCSGWTPGEVRRHGGLLWFPRLWVEPGQAIGSRWAVTVNAFLAARYRPGGRAGLMLLQPFPLEYEGAFSEGDGTPLEPLEARRAAMHRLYARRLGARELGNGWMWRAMDPRLPMPRVQAPQSDQPGLSLR